MKSYVWVWTITSQFLQVVWDRCPIYVLGLCFSSFTSILPSSRRLSFLPWVFSALLLNISWLYVLEFKGFPVGSDGKESACSAADLCLISGLGRSPGKGNGNPLQYSCLENSLNRGAWQVTFHRVAKSCKPSQRLSTHMHRPHRRKLIKHKQGKIGADRETFYRSQSQTQVRVN